MAVPTWRVVAESESGAAWCQSRLESRHVFVESKGKLGHAYQRLAVTAKLDFPFFIAEYFSSVKKYHWFNFPPTRFEHFVHRPGLFERDAHPFPTFRVVAKLSSRGFWSFYPSAAVPFAIPGCCKALQPSAVVFLGNRKEENFQKTSSK